MIGKILHAARVNHKATETRFDENQAEIKDARAKIDEIVGIQEKVDQRIDKMQ